MREIVDAAFRVRGDEAIRCPNKQCEERFEKANFYLLHVKRCKLNSPVESEDENVKKQLVEDLPRYVDYQDFQVFFLYTLLSAPLIPDL